MEPGTRRASRMMNRGMFRTVGNDYLASGSLDVDSDLFAHPDRLDRPRAQGAPRGEREGQQRQQRRYGEDRRELFGWDVGAEAPVQRVGEGE